MKKRNALMVMGKLLILLKPLLGYMFLAITLGLLGNLFATFITIFGSFAISNILGEYTLNTKTIFIIIVIMALLRAFLRYGEQSMNHFIAFKLLARIRDQVFKSLRRLCPAKLETKDAGNLINIITSDIELLEVFYAHTISPLFIGILFSTIMVIFISSYHRTLGIVALCAYLCVGFVLPILINKLGKDIANKHRNLAGKLSSYVLDNLHLLREILQYNANDLRKDKMNRYTDDLLLAEKTMKTNAGINAAISNLIIYFFDLLMLIMSIKLLSIPKAITCTLALMSSYGPVSALAALGSGLQSTLAAGNRVLDILEEEPLIDDIFNKDEIQFNNATGEDINFAYDKQLILENINIEIPKDQIVGICGKSGSGKSTLLKLFMRFWKLNSGQISISNKNIEDINTSNLRQIESFVTQDTHLFHDSIRNNIAIAKLNASDEEIISAAKKANVHEFIQSLPNGYDSQVGELGSTLSSGEKQRIGLARAFLHDAVFILLDEPTSNLDSLNESMILKSLYEEKKNKAIALVSHRESTMRICDVKYSIENGRFS